MLFELISRFPDLWHPEQRSRDRILRVVFEAESEGLAAETARKQNDHWERQSDIKHRPLSSRLYVFCPIPFVQMPTTYTGEGTFLGKRDVIFKEAI